jgi:hypothetical protein
MTRGCVRVVVGLEVGVQRYSLDFVDLLNPKVRRPSVRLEQRIMIGAEVSRCAPKVNGAAEHAAEIGAIDRIAVHAHSDEATRELVHDLTCHASR